VALVARSLLAAGLLAFAAMKLSWIYDGNGTAVDLVIALAECVAAGLVAWRRTAVKSALIVGFVFFGASLVAGILWFGGSGSTCHCLGHVRLHAGERLAWSLSVFATSITVAWIVHRATIRVS